MGIQEPQKRSKVTYSGTKFMVHEGLHEDLVRWCDSKNAAAMKT